MCIESDRRCAFFLHPAGAIHPMCANRLDRLLRGELDAALPTMAGRCIAFAVFHIERFTAPPRVISEYFPQLLLDDRGCLVASTNNATTTRSKPRSIASRLTTTPCPRPSNTAAPMHSTLPAGPPIPSPTAASSPPCTAPATPLAFPRGTPDHSTHIINPRPSQHHSPPHVAPLR